MKKRLFIFACIFFCSCHEQPKIHVSNTLEIALGKRYSAYVGNLNKAFDKDTAALFEFVKIDYINNAAGYDHGFILIQLMKRYGDKDFANILNKMLNKDLINARQYFEVGFDANDKYKNEIKKDYPISSGILQIQ